MPILLDRYLVRDVFLKKYYKEKNFQPKVIQKYLKSLQHFFNFLISEEVKILNMSKGQLQSMINKLVMWHASYIKPSKIATMARM